MATNFARGRGAARRGWIGRVVVLVLVGVAVSAWLVGRSWIMREIVAEAARRGVALGACELELRPRRIGLNECRFGLLPDAAQRGWPLPGVQASGSIQRIELMLAGWRPARLRIDGLEATLHGAPAWPDMLGPGGAPAFPSLPADVERSSVAWYFAEGSAPALSLQELAYRADERRLTSKLALAGGWRGELAFGDEGARVTLGEASPPELRLQARVVAEGQRVELGLELSKLPLRRLEGERLRLTPTLRAIEVDGRVSMTVPTALTMAVPTGHVLLTLHGLQFPVPREVEGLVHGTPPQVSGKLSVARSLDQVTFPELTFLTGSLEMHGPAELELDPEGVRFRTSLSGPLSCRAIAESARRAHKDSVLAKLAGTLAARVLTGSVQVVAAIEGRTPDLERARVLTSIGVGCGLRPLPMDPGLPRELLEQLPELPLGRDLPRLQERLRWPPLPPLAPRKERL